MAWGFDHSRIELPEITESQLKRGMILKNSDGEYIRIYADGSHSDGYVIKSEFIERGFFRMLWLVLKSLFCRLLAKKKFTFRA